MKFWRKVIIQLLLFGSKERVVEMSQDIVDHDYIWVYAKISNQYR